MFGLGVKVLCDTNEVLQGESRIAKFADHFEHKFMKKFSHAVGAGAMAVGAFNAIEEIFGKPKEWEELGKRFQMSGEEIQLITAYGHKMGLTFEQVLEKAKDGSIDLIQVLAQMRGEKGIELVSNEEIEKINEARKALTGLWDWIKTKTIRTVGGALVEAGKPSNQAAMTYWMQNTPGFSGVVPGQPPKTTAQLEAGANAARNEAFLKTQGPLSAMPVPGMALSTLGMSLMPSAGVLRIQEQARLKKEIEALRGERKDAKSPQMELIGGNLTSRQSIGAYTSQSGYLAEKFDQNNDLLRGIDEKIEALTKALEELK